MNILYKKLIIGLLCFICINANAQLFTVKNLNLIPWPQQVEVQEGRLHLIPEFSVSVPEGAPVRLYDYANRFLRRLDGRTGLFFHQSVISEKHPQRPAFPTLTINIVRKSTGDWNEDEFYTLEVSTDKITLSSITDIGAMRGLETLLQLLIIDKNGAYFPMVSITDRPRFAWRGLMLDPARHFLTVDVVKRNLDAMALAKLNVLHLHLNDDQGWRIESKSYPKLHQLASDGQYYTQEQIKDIVKYASDRGIRVYPEIHLPSHATSILVAYPELASNQMPYELERKIGNTTDALLNPANDKVFEFTDKLLAEILPLFPDKYFHVGASLPSVKYWQSNQQILDFMKKRGYNNSEELLDFFFGRMLKAFKKSNKKLIHWNEGLKLPTLNETVVQVKDSYTSLYQHTLEKHQVIFSAPYYLDYMVPSLNYYQADPFATLTDLADSEKKAHLSPEQQRLVMGGEALMWGEMVTNQTIDSRIWPRTLAIAERFWSPQAQHDVSDFYRRIEPISIQLEALDLNHIENTEMILRTLTQKKHNNTLQVLVNILEPYPYYQRNIKGFLYKTYSPLSLIADAVVPDPSDARYFAFRVESYSHTKSLFDKTEIDKWLRIWKDNNEPFIVLSGDNKHLQQLLNLSAQLKKLAEIGLDALSHTETKIVASKSWYETNTKYIDDLRNEYENKAQNAKSMEDGRCKIAILESIQLIVDMANPELGSRRWLQVQKAKSTTPIHPMHY